MLHPRQDTNNKSGLNINEIFGMIAPLSEIYGLGIFRDQKNYNEKEKACFLDNFMLSYRGIPMNHGNEKLTTIAKAINDLKELYGISEYETFESRYTGKTPEDFLESSGCKIFPADVERIIQEAANTNTNIVFGKIQGIIDKIHNLTGSIADNPDELIIYLESLEAQGKIPDNVYALKYQLTRTLELPESATWRFIFQTIKSIKD